jgi:DNA gyrase subunit A
MTLKEILQHFIYHRKTIIIRRTRYDLQKVEARAHILEGLKIALENLDAVIAIIRKSESPATAKERLTENFDLTVTQAQAILDMRLQRLTALEREKIVEEYNNLLKDIAHYKEILAHDRMVLDIIKEELNQIQTDFGDDRLRIVAGRTVVDDLDLHPLCPAILDEDALKCLRKVRGAVVGGNEDGPHHTGWL